MKGWLASFVWFLEHSFKHKQKRTDNLLPYQHETLHQLQQSENLLVVQYNKNLGPALIERDKYVYMVWRDHLSNQQTYLCLTQNEAHAFAKKTIGLVIQWSTKHRKKVSLMEQRFV